MLNCFDGPTDLGPGWDGPMLQSKVAFLQCINMPYVMLSVTLFVVISEKGKERKMPRFNVQFKSQLNQLRLSHESNKTAKKRETKQKTDELIKTGNCPTVP